MPKSRMAMQVSVKGVHSRINTVAPNDVAVLLIAASISFYSNKIKLPTDSRQHTKTIMSRVGRNHEEPVVPKEVSPDWCYSEVKDVAGAGNWQ